MSRSNSRALLLAVLVAGVGQTLPARGGPPVKGGIDVSGPYRAIEGWFKPLHDHRLQCVVSVFAETPERIYVLTEVEVEDTFPLGSCKAGRDAPGAHRHFILVVDGDGRVIEEWSQWRELFGSPHTVKVNPYDPDKHVWIVNEDGNQVYQFTHDGRQLTMTLGQGGVAGADAGHFHGPTDLAFFPDGSFVVSDGLNSRIVKFDSRGRYVAAWGTAGSGPGQFREPHGVSVDARRRIYVADRDNDRIQVFDETGRFLEEWPNIVGVVSVLATSDGALWALSGTTNRLLKYDSNGRLLTYWGTANPSEPIPGSLYAPHAFSVDSHKRLFIADYRNHRLQAFAAVPEADLTRLVGQPVK